MAPNFRVVQVSPKYDGRDGIIGSWTKTVEYHFTKAWALVRVAKLNVEFGDTDLHYEVRPMGSNRAVYADRPVAVVEASASELPF